MKGKQILNILDDYNYVGLYDRKQRQSVNAQLNDEALKKILALELTEDEIVKVMNDPKWWCPSKIQQWKRMAKALIKLRNKKITT